MTETVGVYAIELPERFRGVTVREGLILQGPAGYGEFCPFPEYGPGESAPWLACAVEAATTGWPAPLRDRIPVNCTIPAVGPEKARRMAAESGCGTAKVKVADPGGSLEQDIERVAAVRDGLGGGAIRVDANAAWTVAEAIPAITELDRAAGGLEYVEQPCRTVAELAAVRRRVGVPVAADESIRRADDPLRVALADAADIAVIKVAPLGGVRRALQVAEACGLPCVVSSAVETSIGLAAGLALAAALPTLEHACGLATLSLLSGDVAAEPLQVKDGAIAVPRSAPEPAHLERFAADTETAARWRRRLADVAAVA